MTTEDIAKILVNTLSLDSKVSNASGSQMGFGDSYEIIVDANTGERFQITVTQIT